MWNALKRLITINPMGIFIYTLLSKWYLSIAVAGVVVVFWVFKGLESAGVIDAAERIVSQAIYDSKAVAKFCVPKITDLNAFWYCLNNLPEYSPDKNETDLESQVEILYRGLKKDVYPESPDTADPYYDHGNK